jgi:hypothetical protein
MELETVQKNGVTVAVVKSNEPLIENAQTALDFMATVRYETGCDRVALSKEAVCGDFFRLGTGIAGEILQKFVNYRMKAAFYGDFSGYTSGPLKAFILESNRGRDVFFVSTQEEAVEKLAAAR